MLTLYYLKGLPGSGKTTWAKKKLEELGPNAAHRVNKDDLRSMLDNGVWSRGNERFIVDMERSIAKSVLSSGKHLIVDNTGFNLDHLYFYQDLANKYGAKFELVQDFIGVPVETCIQNDLKRLNSVGEKVIRKMAKQYLAPTRSGIENDPELPYAVICDLDGTLAILGDRDPYDASKCYEDGLNRAVALCVKALAREYNATVFFLSGRSDNWFSETSKWLYDKADFFVDKDNHENLYMRKRGDSRRDSIVKREMYEEHIKGKYNVVAVFDDRPSVISECWRPLGLGNVLFDVGTGEDF